MTTFRSAHDNALANLTAQPGGPFEIGRQTINDVSYLAFLNAPRSIVELIAQGRTYGDQEFLVYADERWSFNDFFAQADKLAYQLINHFKVSKGDRVAIAMRNYPEWLTAYVAIVSIGAVAVPINSWGRAAELQQTVADAETNVIICDQQRFDLLEVSAHDQRAIVVRPQHDSYPDGSISLDKLLASVPSTAKEQLCPQVAIDGEDPAMIMYTSGTSGKPKGAVFSHRSCCQAIVNLELSGAAAYMTNTEAFTRQMQMGLAPKNLLAVPLFHVSGLYSQFLLNLRGGRGLVMMYKWDPAKACELIENERITTIMAAPSMVLDMLRCDKFKSIDASCIGNVAGGGAASPPKLFELTAAALPNALPGVGYGMTESGGIGCSFMGEFVRQKPLSCGFVSPIVELRFCDANGVEVPAGTEGEIWLKSPTNVSGYWKRPQETRSEFQHGWFKTGDIGYLDEDGCMVICDRVKEMVIRGGENIYPIEVENCIQSMPGINSVAAFGIPSEAMGEELVAVVQVSNTDTAMAITEQQVKEYCAGQLAGFKVPSMVKVTAQVFPRNASNKILKKALRDEYFPTAAN